LAKLREFRAAFFTADSAPAESTLRRQIDNDQLPGGTRVGHLYYVDLDEYARATNLRANLIAQQRELRNHPLLRDLL
jgi:hypothetical protein